MNALATTGIDIIKTVTGSIRVLINEYFAEADFVYLINQNH